MFVVFVSSNSLHGNLGNEENKIKKQQFARGVSLKRPRSSHNIGVSDSDQDKDDVFWSSLFYIINVILWIIKI